MKTSRRKFTSTALGGGLASLPLSSTCRAAVRLPRH